MKKSVYILCLLILLGTVQIIAAKSPAGAFSIDLTAGKRVYTRSIGKDLLLRVIKDSSVSQKHFGWLIEVVRKPYRKDSRNLIYQNPTGTTADLSQVYAWHVGNPEFPDKRRLEAQGYPLILRIDLVDPQTKGTGPDAGFVSGKLKIKWQVK